MKKIYQVKKKESLKENLRLVLPEMFDDFYSQKETVAAFPQRKNLLHEMRKSGKPLRYAMELGEYCFGNEFTRCLEEVKHSIELMGEIHDADVMIPEINLSTKEIRLFNSTLKNAADRISTKMMRDISVKLRNSRQIMYEELIGKLNMWEKDDFRNRLLIAMEDQASTGDSIN